MLNSVCELNTCCQVDHIFFFKEGLVYFSKTMPNHILLILEEHGSVVRVWVLNWPACSADLSPIENVWCIMKHKVQGNPKLLSR